VVIYEDEYGQYHIEERVSNLRTEQRLTGWYDKLNFDRLYDFDLSEDWSGDGVELDSYKVSYYNTNWDIYPETEHVRIPDFYRPDEDSDFLLVAAIGQSAFQSMNSQLGGITIPESVKNIFEDAFCWSDKLRSVTIPKSVLEIRARAFMECTSLETVTFAEGSQLETIGNFAFGGCSNLTTISTIPASVEVIGFSDYYGSWWFDDPFSDCNFIAINVDVANPYYESHDGILYLSGLLKYNEYGYWDIDFNDPEISVLAIPTGLSGAVTLPATLRKYNAGELRFGGITSQPPSQKTVCHLW